MQPAKHRGPMGPRGFNFSTLSIFIACSWVHMGLLTGFGRTKQRRASWQRRHRGHVSSADRHGVPVAGLAQLDARQALGQ